MKVHAMFLATMGLLGLANLEAWSAEVLKESPRTSDYRISGPYTEGNLTIFLIHGKDAIPDKKYLTLAEALEQKKAVVHETKNVNEVSVENLSTDADLYLEGGDIIKGGQQDRVISMDLIVKPKSGKVPLPCFCVEAGRWSQRGSEAAANFASSPGKAAGKEIQLAAQYRRDQGGVWEEVAKSQGALSRNVGRPVQASASPSSLQLSQENKKLLEMVERYAKQLSKAPDKEKDVIGYAAAINGKVENFDVYGSSALFAKLWPRLLRASAIEAVAALPKDSKKFEAATAAAVVKMLDDADKSKKKEEKVVNGRVHLVTRKSDNNFFFETRDRENASQPVHKSGK